MFKVLNFKFAILSTVVDMKRTRMLSARFNIYSDGNIPTEYYKEEYLEFEEFADRTNLRIRPYRRQQSVETQPEFLLRKFKKYEEWMKADRKKLSQKKQQKQQGLQDKKFTKSTGKAKKVNRGARVKVHKCFSQYSCFCMCFILLQEIRSTDECRGFNDANEINAIHLCLIKAISANSYQRGSRSSNVKKLSIDVPCSPKIFLSIVEHLPAVNYLGQDNFKFAVTATEMEGLFGNNWHTFNYAKSSTRRRIIGLIIIHYRKKSIPQSR